MQVILMNNKYLPNGIITYVFTYTKPYKDYFNIVLTELMIKQMFKELPFEINKNGIMSYEKLNAKTEYNFDVESLTNIYKCKTEIKELYLPSKSISESSYGGKHYIEKYRKHINPNINPYISNGEYIIAMLLSFSKYKYINDYGPNLCFYVKHNKKMEKQIYDNTNCFKFKKFVK